MMKTIALLVLLVSPAAANRAVMEQLAASANTIFVDTINVRVGISTITPATTLDVAGAAQFGQGATKSTFTVAGALVIASGSSITLSGTTGSLVSVASITAGAFYGDISHLTGNITGNAATVTTNANLTGPVTSAGNATSIPGPVPQSAINLSTVTTALALYMPLTGGLFSGVVTNSSTETIKGNAFSVGGSTFVVSGGNVGIGTTNPTSLLYVNQGSIAVAPSGTAFLTTTNGQVSGTLSINSTVMDFADNLDITLSPGSSEKVRLKNNGNVGIGTTSPSTTLQVVGGVSASTLSVTGATFSVGGSSFSVTGGSATVAYSLTANSVTADLTSNATGFELINVATTTSVASSFNACITGTSQSLSCPAAGCAVFLAASGGVQSNGGDTIINHFSFLVDGTSIGGNGILYFNSTPTASRDMAYSMQYLKLGLSSGSHTFCPSIWVSGGTATLNAANSFAGFIVH